MNEVRRLRHVAGVTQEFLARAAGTSQPTIALYETGRRSPTLATLHRLAGSIGMDVYVDFHPAMTREERRSLYLHQVIARKLAEDQDAVLRLARSTLDRMMERHGGPKGLLKEWAVLIERPLPDLIALLTDPSPHARQLRHVTPFAGVLAAAERADTYRAFAAGERVA